MVPYFVPRPCIVGRSAHVVPTTLTDCLILAVNLPKRSINTYAFLRYSSPRRHFTRFLCTGMGAATSSASAPVEETSLVGSGPQIDGAVAVALGSAVAAAATNWGEVTESDHQVLREGRGRRGKRRNKNVSSSPSCKLSIPDELKLADFPMPKASAAHGSREGLYKAAAAMYNSAYLDLMRSADPGKRAILGMQQTPARALQRPKNAASSAVRSLRSLVKHLNPVWGRNRGRNRN